MKKRVISAILALMMLLPACISGCSPAKDPDDTSSGDGTENSGSGEHTLLPDGPFDGYILRATTEDSYDISDNLFGIFLEDINFAVDGGLYAELICNRSFEYGNLAGGGKFSWEVTGNVLWNIITGTADSTALNENNTHFARVTNNGDSPAGIYSTGFFNEMYVEGGKEYKFSVYARSVRDYDGALTITIESSPEKVYATATIDSLTDEWHKYSLTLTPSATPRGAHLAVRIGRGTVDLDMVSLFPADTYKGRENGIRREIGEALEALEPNFFRFPGGCIIEGSTLDKAYNWKDSIGGALEFEVNGEATVGDVAARPLGDNIWSWNWQPYYMSYGLGFYEYFLLCEDLDCEPVPVVNCGMSCQGQPGPNGVEALPTNSDEFRQYIQDALDLVEFCLGDESTYWGGVRAAMGHPEKFELHYIGIGNEQWGPDYNTRYAFFREAFREAAESDPDLYGNVKLIMANGPLSSSHDGWDVVASEGNDIADLLDEHYYNDPEWFFASGSRYDTYDREGPTVFLGEFAAKSNTSKAAIAEAAYMTSLERNGDIVELAAYAPLLAFNGHTQWTPDLIWFSGRNVWHSVNYYVQKIFSTNQPDSIVPSELDPSGYDGNSGIKGKIGLGTWQTSAKFSDLKVTDNKTGNVLYENDFSSADLSDCEIVSGNFSARGGYLYQGNTGYPGNDVTGDVIYIGDDSWTNYTLEFTAQKTGGAEGFIIPFAVGDSKNFWHWNIGGWANTLSCLQYCSGGAKSAEIDGTIRDFAVETGVDYRIKIVIDGYTVKGYINDGLMIDFDTFGAARRVYSVIGEDENDVIVKIVNASKERVPFRINVSAVTSFSGKANVESIDFISEETENGNNNERVSIVESTVDVSPVFDYDMGAFSMVVIRIPKK